MPKGVTYTTEFAAEISREAVVDYLEQKELSLLGQCLATTNFYVDFSDADLSHMDLRYFFPTEWRSQEFSETEFVRTNFSNSTLNRTVLNGNMREARFNDSSIQSAFLKGNFTKAKFKKANLDNVTISGNIEGANLSGATFIGANCSNNSFMKRAIFTKADLTNAKFILSNNSGAVFYRTNLTGADISASNFQNANFTKANLLETDISYCNFDGANFTDIKNLDKIKICVGAFFINVKGLKPKQLEMLKEKGAITSKEELLELVNDDTKWAEFRNKHNTSDLYRETLSNMLPEPVSPEQQIARELKTIAVLHNSSRGWSHFSQLPPDILMEIVKHLSIGRLGFTENGIQGLMKSVIEYRNKCFTQQIKIEEAEPKRVRLRKKIHDLKEKGKNKLHIKSQNDENETEENPSHLSKHHKKRKFETDENGNKIESSSTEDSVGTLIVRHANRKNISRSSSYFDLLEKSDLARNSDSRERE